MTSWADEVRKDSPSEISDVPFDKLRAGSDGTGLGSGYTQDYHGFRARCSRQVCVCGFLHRKPQEAPWFHQPAQEIRVRPGLLSAVPSGLTVGLMVLIW
jgi:hypothetical protein